MADTKETGAQPPAQPDGSAHFEEGNMSIGRYLATRVTTLIPPMNKAPNPFTALMMLNKQQWLFFLVSFI
jgi:MFS transporter, SHS family, lactate transporter